MQQNITMQCVADCGILLHMFILERVIIYIKQYCLDFRVIMIMPSSQTTAFYNLNISSM